MKTKCLVWYTVLKAKDLKEFESQIPFEVLEAEILAEALIANHIARLKNCKFSMLFLTNEGTQVGGAQSEKALLESIDEVRPDEIQMPTELYHFLTLFESKPSSTLH